MNARVLVADDAATVRAYYTSILRPLGFEVVEAPNGYEAYERAVQERFDLFVFDVNMPGLDGYSLVERLRAAEATASVPTVMISTESADVDRNRAYAAGANLYLTKPVAPDHLAMVVRVLVEGEVDAR